MCPGFLHGGFVPGADVRRVVYEVPNSEQRYWLTLMKEQRALYRLALGQPNQEDLLHFLSTDASRLGNPREFTLELSAFFTDRRLPGP